MMRTAEGEDKRDLMAGMSASAIPQRKSSSVGSSQQIPAKVAAQLSKPLASSTTKTARRQFRESMREIAGDSSSDCSSLPRNRQPRSITQVSREKSRPGSVVIRPSGETPSGVGSSSKEGFFRNESALTRNSSNANNRTILSTVSGQSKTRPPSNTIKSQGSVSIDSLSGSSSYSQKIAFSETNMQSSLGYLP